MGFLSNLIGSKNTSQPDASDFVVALSNKIDEHRRKHGKKPEMIYVLGEISNRLAHAGFYTNVAHHEPFKDVEFVPVGAVPDGLMWMTDKDWAAHPEIKAQEEELLRIMEEGE